MKSLKVDKCNKIKIKRNQIFKVDYQINFKKFQKLMQNHQVYKFTKVNDIHFYLFTNNTWYSSVKTRTLNCLIVQVRMLFHMVLSRVHASHVTLHVTYTWQLILYIDVHLLNILSVWLASIFLDINVLHISKYRTYIHF